MLCSKAAERQAADVLGARALKKGGCMANLLVSLLASEHSGVRAVTVMPRDIRSLGFCRFAPDGSLASMIRPGSGGPPEGFAPLVDANQNPVGARGKEGGVFMRLTALGRWMAFSLMWDMSLFALCLSAEINLHNCSAHAKNSTICGGSCSCHGIQRVGARERSASAVNPFTVMRFARRFPSCSRCKISRTLRELEDLDMISVTKSMHCNVIRPDLGHPLFSRHSLILSRLSDAVYGIDTLENTSRAIRLVRPARPEARCPRT